MRILISAATAALLAFGCLSASAATVTTTLDLLPLSATENTLRITLLVGGMAVGFDDTDLSGTMDVSLEIDATNTVTAFRMTGGTFAGTDWTIPLGGGLEVNATGTGGTFITPGMMASPVPGTSYDAAEHDIIINQGIVNAPGAMFDFSQPGEALTESGTGMGSLVLTPTANPQEFDLRVDFPLSFISDIDATTQLQIVGTVVGQGVVAVPEASSFVMLSVIVGGGGLVRMRRRRQQTVAAG